MSAFTVKLFQRRVLLAMLVLFGIAISPASNAQAPTYPNKPIRIVVGFPPGNTLDTISRVIGEHLRVKLGQPVIVENKPGANGVLGVTEVARASPDGYTLLATNSSSMVVNPQLYRKLGYQSSDLAPLTMVVAAPMILTVNPANERVAMVNTVADLVALAKARPGELAYASGGLGNLAHLGMTMINNRAGILTNHVPYKGSTAAQQATLAKEVDAQLDTPLALPLIKQGRLRALAVTGAKRLPELPEVPTLAEAGIRGVEFNFWLGLFAPAQTPAAILQLLYEAINSVRENPDAMRVLAAQGGVELADPSTFAARIRSVYTLWGDVIKRENIQLD